MLGRAECKHQSFFFFLAFTFVSLLKWRRDDCHMFLNWLYYLPFLSAILLLFLLRANFYDWNLILSTLVFLLYSGDCVMTR